MEPPSTALFLWYYTGSDILIDLLFRTMSYRESDLGDGWVSIWSICLFHISYDWTIFQYFLRLLPIILLSFLSFLSHSSWNLFLLSLPLHSLYPLRWIFDGYVTIEISHSIQIPSTFNLQPFPCTCTVPILYLTVFCSIPHYSGATICSIPPRSPASCSQCYPTITSGLVEWTLRSLPS